VFLRRQQKQQLIPDESEPGPGSRRQEILQRIRDLRQQMRYSKIWMVLFFLVSIAAAVNFRFLPPISEDIKSFLGASPPPALISIALIVYAFSALFLILGRMNAGSTNFRGWSHLGYLTAFYLFYYYCGLLRDNFWPVFIAGLTILGLEDYRVWSVCSEAIKKEEEILSVVKK